MALVIDAHNHIGVRHGAAQTGLELVAKMDAVGVDKAVVLPFVEGTIDNSVIQREVQTAPDRLSRSARSTRGTATARSRTCGTAWRTSASTA